MFCLKPFQSLNKYIYKINDLIYVSEYSLSSPLCSKYVNTGNIKEVISLAGKSKGKDNEGYRAEFVRLAKSVNDMQCSLACKE